MLKASLDINAGKTAKQLSEYVNDIEMAIEAMTGAEKKISDAELYTRKRARRSLYAARDLEIGHIVTEDDVLVVRPENTMNADEYDAAIGSVLTADMRKYEPFRKEFLKK